MLAEQAAERVLRPGQLLPADNARRAQHPDPGCWHWRHYMRYHCSHRRPDKSLGLQRFKIRWWLRHINAGACRAEGKSVFSSLAQNLLNLHPQRVKYGRENSLSSTQLCNDKSGVFEWPGIAWSKVLWPVLGPETTSSSSLCISCPSWCVKQGKKDCSDHKSLRNGTGADRVGGKSASESGRALGCFGISSGDTRKTPPSGGGEPPMKTISNL